MRLRSIATILAMAGSSLFAAGPDLAPRLASPYQPYRLRLTKLVAPPSITIGLGLEARIDGGPPLRLLLDSGAQYLVVARRAVRRSGRNGGTGLDLVGAGSPRAARLTTAGTVEVGPLTLLDCPMVVVEGRVLDGADGVIPLALFARFLVHLDVRGRRLELEPYSEATAPGGPGFVRMRAEHNLLFLETRLEDTHDGFLLLDTGSSFNVVSNAVATRLKQALSMAEPLSIQAGTGETDGRRLSCSVTYRFGNSVRTLDPVVAVDLAEMSRRHRMDVSGVIGYPALAESVVTVNYRDSLVRIESR